MLLKGPPLFMRPGKPTSLNADEPRFSPSNSPQTWNYDKAASSARRRQHDGSGRNSAGALTSYGDDGFSIFIRRAFLKGMGLSNEDMEKPVIGICNTWSELNSCHRHLREVAEAVKRGVWQAGGLPLEFPTISLGEHS